jgi:hypothetical protein
VHRQRGFDNNDMQLMRTNKRRHARRTHTNSRNACACGKINPNNRHRHAYARWTNINSSRTFVRRSTFMIDNRRRTCARSVSINIIKRRRHTGIVVVDAQRAYSGIIKHRGHNIIAIGATRT